MDAGKGPQRRIVAACATSACQRKRHPSTAQVFRNEELAVRGGGGLWECRQ